jgi:arsenate reductase
MIPTAMSGKYSLFSKTICRRRQSRKNPAVRRIVARQRRPEHRQFLASGKGFPMEKKYNVLFLCTGNSARSIMAEAILNRKGRPNFTAYSAGSHPWGVVRPEALKQIELSRASTEGLRSKSWDEFARPDAPRMDFVFTVCDNAANEICPVWPGQPITAHWGVPDPAAVKGSPEQIERAFRDAFMTLDRRITLLLSLPLPTLGQLAIKNEVDRIGGQ